MRSASVARASTLPPSTLPSTIPIDGYWLLNSASSALIASSSPP